VTDIHLLFTIAALMGSTMLFGWQMEVLNGNRLPTFAPSDHPSAPPAPLSSPDAGLPFITDARVGFASAAAAKDDGPSAPGSRVDWGPFWMGCWPFVAVTAVTGCFFFQAVSKHDPPTFVW
jgi:hypothetical protein